MDLHRSVGLETPTLRRADIAAVTGVPREQSVRWWRAMGFPEVGDDVVAFSEVDVDLVQRVAGLVDAGLVDDDDVARLARLLGASCQRIAEAQLELADEIFERAANLDPDAAASDRLKVLLDERGTALMMLLERSVVYVWKRHMQAALGRHLDTGLDSVHSTDVLAVGFADLAGFTKLSKGLTPPELTEVIDGFEAAAFESAAGTDGRVVKLIGDEVMFATVEPDQACAIALALTRIADMPARGGLAHGQVVTSGGDLYGPVVNLASRIADVAVPGEVLVDQAVVDAVRTDPHVRIEIDVEPAGRRQLKGFAEPVRLWSISER